MLLAPRAPARTVSILTMRSRMSRAYACHSALHASRLLSCSQSDSNHDAKPLEEPQEEPADVPSPPRQRGILFAPDVKGAPDSSGKALYIPSPRDRDRGYPIIERDIGAVQNDARSEIYYDEEDNATAKPSVSRSLTAPVIAGPSRRPSSIGSRSSRRRPFSSSHVGAGPALAAARSMERVASNVFVLGLAHGARPGMGRGESVARSADLPYLSREATIGRNSRFLNLSHEDRERLGGIEYRALRLLLRIVLGKCTCGLPGVK